MTKLTDSQTRLLTFAATAETGTIPATDHPRTIDALLTRGLIIDVPDGDGPRRLRITDAGRGALAGDGEDQVCGEGDGAGDTPDAEIAEDAPPPPPARRRQTGALVALDLGDQTPIANRAAIGAAPEPSATPKEPKGKTAALVALLRRPDGATIEAMTAATGWQAHSVRGCLSGAIKKGLGLEIASEKTHGVRIYRIVEPAA